MAHKAFIEIDAGCPARALRGTDQSGSIQGGSRFLPRARLIRSSKREEVSSKLAISSDTGSRHET